MPSNSTRSRRRILAAGASALSLGVAGCAGDGSQSGSTSEHRAADGRTIESTHEYETLHVRSDDDEPFVYESESAADEDADDRQFHSRRSQLFVLDEDDADALHLETDDTDANEIRTFVEKTNFDAQSIVVEQRAIEDCYRRTLVGVRAEDDEFRTEFCQTLKDATTPCEADLEVVEAIVIRVHRPYEEQPSSYGSSESHVCRDPLRGSAESTANETSDGTATNETHDSDATIGANSIAGTEVEDE